MNLRRIKMWKKEKYRWFRDLSEKEREKVLSKHKDYVDPIYDDDVSEYKSEKEAYLEKIGFSNPKIRYTGFWSQGDGACFTGDLTDFKAFASEKVACPDLVKELFERGEDIYAHLEHSGRYCHERSVSLYLRADNLSSDDELIYRSALDEYESALDEWRLDKCQEIYRELEAIYDRTYSDDNLAEVFEENCVFDEMLRMYNEWEVEGLEDDEEALDEILKYSKRIIHYLKSHNALLLAEIHPVSSEKMDELEDAFYNVPPLSEDETAVLKKIAEEHYSGILDEHDIEEIAFGRENV